MRMSDFLGGTDRDSSSTSEGAASAAVFSASSASSRAKLFLLLGEILFRASHVAVLAGGPRCRASGLGRALHVRDASELPAEEGAREREAEVDRGIERAALELGRLALDPRLRLANRFLDSSELRRDALSERFALFVPFLAEPVR